MATKKAWINVQVPAEVKKSLSALAKTNDVSLSGYVRKLLKKALEAA